MPELEDFLASLEREETDQEQESNPGEPIDPKKFKEWAYKQRKESKAYERELKELREFQAKTVAEQRVSALRAAGLNEFHAEAFSKFYPEVTPENVEEYRVRAGLEAAPAGNESPAAETAEPPSPGFAPTSIGTPPPPGKTYSRAEWIALANTDSATAQRVFQEGRVDLSGLREGLGPE